MSTSVQMSGNRETFFLFFVFKISDTLVISFLLKVNLVHDLITEIR